MSEESKKNNTVRNIIIAVIILIILLLMLFKGCTQCQTEAPTPPEPVADRQESEPVTTAPPVEEGKVFVTSAGEMLFKVRAAEVDENGNKKYTEITEGRCNLDKVPVHPGSYEVFACPNGKEIFAGFAEVENGKTTTIAFKGFGTLGVGAITDFLKYKVLNEQGQKVGGGDTNITRNTLAVGTYTVTVKPSGYPEVTIGPFNIKDGEDKHVKMGGFGKLHIRAVKDFLKIKVLDKDGNDIGTFDTNISTKTIPAGTYTAVTGFSKLENVTIGPFEVKGDEDKTVTLTGFGTVGIRASKDFMKYQIIDSNGKIITSGDTNISNHFLPVGDYSVKFGDTVIPGLVIKEWDKLSFESGL